MNSDFLNFCKTKYFYLSFKSLNIGKFFYLVSKTPTLGWKDFDLKKPFHFRGRSSAKNIFPVRFSVKDIEVMASFLKILCVLCLSDILNFSTALPIYYNKRNSEAEKDLQPLKDENSIQKKDTKKNTRSSWVPSNDETNYVKGTRYDGGIVTYLKFPTCSVIIVVFQSGLNICLLYTLPYFINIIWDLAWGIT